MLEYINLSSLLTIDYTYCCSVFTTKQGLVTIYGHDNYITYDIPEPVLGIKCSGRATVSITCFNNVYWCKEDGIGTEIASLNDDTVVSMCSFYNDVFIVTESGRVYRVEENSFIEHQTTCSLKVKTIVAKYSRILYITHEGEVYGEGDNTHFLMGKTTEPYVPLTKLSLPPCIISIDTNQYFTVAVTDKGKVWSCHYGEWVEAKSVDNIVDVKVGYGETTLVDTEGKERCCNGAPK